MRLLLAQKNLSRIGTPSAWLRKSGEVVGAQGKSLHFAGKNTVEERPVKQSAESSCDAARLNRRKDPRRTGLSHGSVNDGGWRNKPIEKSGQLSNVVFLKKVTRLALLATRGLVPEWGFGNRDSDAQTYRSSNVEGDHCSLYQWDDPGLGCRRVDDYTSLLPEIKSASPACE